MYNKMYFMNNYHSKDKLIHIFLAKDDNTKMKVTGHLV